MCFVIHQNDVSAVLDVALVTLSFELLLVLAFFRSAHLSCQNTLLYFSVQNMYFHEQSRYLLFGSAMLGLNIYSWMFPWYFANVAIYPQSLLWFSFILLTAMLALKPSM